LRNREGKGLNTSYLKALDKLTFAKADVERLWEEGQEQVRNEGKTFEDRQAYYILENIIENLDTAIYELKRYTLPVIEGKLLEDKELGKFELIREDNGKGLGWLFSCGDYLEVYDQEYKDWYPGRVEHMTRNGTTGYYFYCNTLKHPFLYTGMKVRIRRK